MLRVKVSTFFHRMIKIQRKLYKANSVKNKLIFQPLDEIFKSATSSEPLHKTGPPSAADKEEAERLKTEGNNLMRTEKFPDALLMYSKVGIQCRF
jgi:hypothetical protein